MSYTKRCHVLACRCSTAAANLERKRKGILPHGIRVPSERDRVDAEVLKDYRDLERNVVIAVGVTLGWLFDKRADVPSWAWFLPLLFAVLGAIRATGILQAFGSFKCYIRKLETAFSNAGDPQGWEHFPRSKTSTARFAVGFWVLLLLVTVIIGGYEYCSRAHPAMPF
jgi:hypothetical protein